MRFHFRRLEALCKKKTSQGKAQPLRLFTFVETMFRLGFVTMRFFLRPTSNEHHSRDVIKCVAYLKSTLNDRYCSNVTNDLYGALIFYYLTILEVNVNRISTFCNTRFCRIKFGKITYQRNISWRLVERIFYTVWERIDVASNVAW